MVTHEDDIRLYRKMAKEQPHEFLRKLENTGSVMFGPQQQVAAELLRKAWGTSKDKVPLPAPPEAKSSEATTTRRRRRR